MPALVGILAVILLAVGWIGYIAVDRTAQVTEDLYEHPFAVSTAVLRIQANVISLNRLMKNVVLASSLEEIEQYRQDMEQTKREIANDFVLVQDRFLGDPALVQEIMQAYSRTGPILDEVIKLKLDNRNLEATTLAMTAGTQNLRDIEAKIDNVRNFAREKSRAFLENAKETRSTTLGLVLISLIAGMGLAGVIFYKAIQLESKLKEQNEQLEQKVQERTLELSTANENLTAQTEEITAQNEEMIAQNEEIRSINEEVESLNQTLTGMNEELEKRVAERTSDLTAANQEIIAQYDDLRQAQRAQQRNAEIQDVLKKIAEAALLTSSLDELYDAVHGLMGRVLPVENFHINFLDEAAGELAVQYFAGEMKGIPRKRALGKGVMEYVMRNRKAVHIDSAEFDRLFKSGEIVMKAMQANDWLCSPLINSRGRVYGTIALNSLTETQSFRQEDVETLSTIAAQISMAIERKLAEEERLSSQARYQALVEQSCEGLVLVDIETREVVEINRRFTEMFGWSLPEDAPLYNHQCVVDSQQNFDRYYNEILRQQRSIPTELRTYRHKNGLEIPVERAGTVITLNDKDFLLVSVRDMTAERRHQAGLTRDADMAARVQKALLSMPESSDYLEVASIFQPFGYVGGDLYFMDWRYGGNLLRGFLVDTTGHELSTALHTASLHVLLREVNEQDLPLADAMRWLNRRAGGYFDEGIFAGAIAFEVDLQTWQLRWTCAGIPQIWVDTEPKQGFLECPGMFLGIHEDETFDTHSLPIAVGDSFYFMTDGFADRLGRRTDLPLDRYAEMLKLLRSMSEAEDRRDDATAICIRVRSLPQSVVSQDGWPRILRFNGYGDYQRFKGEIGKILAEVTGLPHSIHEVAVNEALANAMECRDGVPRQHKARLRFNKVGNRLIVRVKTSRIGFAGNVLLRRLRLHPEEMFSLGEDAAMGRGIPMMLSMSHKMTYNSEGTEVLLAWKLES